MDEEKELALRKYAELYEHSKAVLAEELARSHRTDEKASKYLTALSLVLGALVFFFQQLAIQRTPTLVASIRSTAYTEAAKNKKDTHFSGAVF